MNINSLRHNITPQKIGKKLTPLLERQDIIIWGMTATVPFIRMGVDNKEEKKHFRRDVTSFVGGTAAYFTGSIASNQFLEKTKSVSLKKLAPELKKSISTLVGSLTWLALITYGTVKLSKSPEKQAEKQKEQKEQKPQKNIRKLDVKEENTGLAAISLNSKRGAEQLYSSKDSSFDSSPSFGNYSRDCERKMSLDILGLNNITKSKNNSKNIYA